MGRTGSRFFAPHQGGSVSLANEVRALIRELRCGRVQPFVCALDRHKDLQTVDCAICLDICVDPCTLRGCPSASSHTFCLSCITRWAEVATWCPLCKLRFDAIIPPNGEPIEVQARSPGSRVEGDEVVGTDAWGNVVTAREYIQWIEEQLCQGCGGGGDETRPGMGDAETLLCDGCDEAWHMACLRPPLTTIPEGDWKCPHCVETEREKNEEQAAKRTRLVEVKDGDEPLLEALNRLNGEVEKLEKVLQRRQEMNERWNAALHRQTEATRAADFDRFRYAAQSEHSEC